MCFSKTIKTNVCNYGRKPLTAIATSQTKDCTTDGHCTGQKTDNSK